jgi:hypothetical protein
LVSADRRGGRIDRSGEVVAGDETRHALLLHRLSRRSRPRGPKSLSPLCSRIHKHGAPQSTARPLLPGAVPNWMSRQLAPENPVLAAEPVALPRVGNDELVAYEEPVVTRRELWSYYRASLTTLLSL